MSDEWLLGKITLVMRPSWGKGCLCFSRHCNIALHR